MITGIAGELGLGLFIKLISYLMDGKAAVTAGTAHFDRAA